MAYAVFNDGATDGRELWVDYEFTDEAFVEDLGEKGPGRSERVELFACPGATIAGPRGSRKRSASRGRRSSWRAGI